MSVGNRLHPNPPLPQTPPSPAPPAAFAERATGTYTNPVLFADYSDPDAICVGADFWLTASSFNHVPGLPILHSRDLVTWTLVNHALPRLQPADHFSKPRHGGGVWAPALRFHTGRFWLFFPDPDFGIFVTTADDPRGAWSEPVCVKAGKGLIDPCPFWDDDGAGYLIHGWAKSRSGINNRLTLHRLRTDGLAVADAGEVVIDGDKLEGWHTIEGPKLYKRNGYYYVSAPAGGVREGYQAVFRSRSLYGPFDKRIVLAQGRTQVNGPHQGAWVETPAGEHWFLHFQEQPAFGRVVHLQPMRWQDDWPHMGNPCGDGPGEPVATYRRPAVVSAPAAERREVPIPPRADDAATPASKVSPFVPAPEWQWVANPDASWFSTDGDAWRLACVRFPAAANLWHASHLLLHKFEGPAFVASATIELHAQTDGARTGLLVFGHDYAWLGLIREAGHVRVTLRSCVHANKGGNEHEIASAALSDDAAPCSAAPSVAGPRSRAPSLEFRVTVDHHARCQFAYRTGDGTFRDLGPLCQAKSGNWVGAKVGVFAGMIGPPDATHADHAIVRRFTFDRAQASA